MPVPNLYNPYVGLDLAQSAGNELGQLGQKAVQDRLQFQEQQRQEAQPSGIKLSDWQKIHEALANGADPDELAMRYKMKNAGHLQHVAQGLSDDHPITQSHPYAPQTGLGPQQQVPSEGMGNLQQSEQGPQSEQPQQNPQPQGPAVQPGSGDMDLSYGQLKQLPHMLAETSAERANREQERTRIAGEYGVAKQQEITSRMMDLQAENAQLRKELEGMKQRGTGERAGTAAGARVRSAQIGANARIRVAEIMADARRATARAGASQDPKVRQMGAELNKLIGEEASMAQPGANDTDPEGRRSRIDQLRKEIDSRVGLPATGGGRPPAAQFGNPGNTGSNAWDSIFGVK